MDIFETKNFHSALPFWQYQFPHANQVNSSQDMAPKIHSQYPSKVGTTVFGLKYKDGVIIATDAIRNYGKLSQYSGIGYTGIKIGFKLQSSRMLQW